MGTKKVRCPDEIADILLRITGYGIVFARECGDMKRAAIEADHVHNLPELVRNYQPRNLRYYWRAERERYIRQSPNVGNTIFVGLWAELEPFIPKEN